MAYFHYENAQSIILNIADDAVIANAVTPKTNKWSSQHFAYATRVFPRRDAFLHIVNNAPRRLLVKLFKLILGCFGVINCPSQGLLLHWLKNRLFLLPYERAPLPQQQGSTADSGAPLHLRWATDVRLDIEMEYDEDHHVAA